VASINLADELLILLIFVNMSILLTQSQWERYRMRTKCECRRCVGRDLEQFIAKAIIRVHKNEINCGHFEHLM